jgi:hypothetical protein
MGEILVTSGPYEVVAAGTITSFGGNPVTIVYGRPSEFRLTFRFIDDPTRKDESRVEAKAIDAFSLELTLMNFGSPFGEGTEKPAQIGRLDAGDLFLHYRIYAHADMDKTVQFTLYRRPPDSTDG